MVDILSSLGTFEIALWIVFGAAVALSISLGLILMYHWFKHAHNTVVSSLATAIYIGVCMLLLSTMLGSLVSYF